MELKKKENPSVDNKLQPKEIRKKVLTRSNTKRLRSELEEEIDKNTILIDQITQEIATVVDEIRDYTDKNEEMEKVRNPN